METTEITANEPFKDAKSSRDVYLRLLGRKELPKSPEDMPEGIFLPSTVLGSLEQALIEFEKDGRERAEVIKWDKRNRKFKPSGIAIGTKTDVSLPTALWEPSFGSKPLLVYHTHPHEDPTFFSHSDLAKSRAFPREAFISLVGSRNGVVALFQTEKTSKLPFSSFITYSSVLKRLERENPDLIISAVLKFLQDEGFAVYAWEPPTFSPQRDDMKNGLVVAKIENIDTWSRIFTRGNNEWRKTGRI